ncbi:MAG: PH domain-containing protein [Cryobacterium sp.]|nr:PH domain-containing protein [Cryobacterium sp.]
MTANGTAELADGQWHRLHPASPLLKGGLALVAVLGVVIANLRERIMHLFIPITNEFSGEEDPVDFIVANGLIGWAALVLAALLIVLIAGFYASWRMHTFRITGEAVEVRSGILFRTNRKARLDRIQGINIVRPMFARLFGAAKLEINQAGQDANVLLSYLGSAAADQLRVEILRLASGSRSPVARDDSEVQSSNFVERRVNELLAPELDPNLAPPESVVKLDMGRLIGSILLSNVTLVVVMIGIVTIVATVMSGELFILLTMIPAAISIGGYSIRRFTKSLRYSIAKTPDGIRVGYGLLSISNETLPPGRIHSIRVSQSLLWRPVGWWEVKVNIASRSATNKGADGQGMTTLLPVGDREDVRKVLELALPELDEANGRSPILTGIETKGFEGDGFSNSPRRAIAIRPFSWRRNGFAITPRSIVLRKGAIWRQLVVVPQPRIQSISMEQGPLLRALSLAAVKLHTVAGPITADIGALGVRDAIQFFENASAVAIDAAKSDRTHRWRDGQP